ncbi:zinc finger and BTB domain-containing protein 47 [Nephila pilipes]|uniref:Zinc finger and BTB domain-containing protein 47 n=1 Tax=Nephila pilipes TaxID=299642 RepID=A0A8X6T6I7_NEPPI|nr:zinc finger and BTB domain-containing protein 47 [Nephila pilipes]
MSVVRIVTRIIPTNAQDKSSVSHLLVAKDIDTPLRTEWSCSGDQNTGNYVVYETTFCKENVLPPNVDVDSTIASTCNSISGLVNLKKSRLRLTNETRSYDSLEELRTEPVIRVSPEVLSDGTCAGILLSVPLRLSRSEIEDSPDVSHFNVASTSVEERVSNEPISPDEQIQNHGDSIPADINSCESLDKYFNGNKCLLCDFISNSETEAKDHLESHMKMKHLQCNICGELFATTLLLHYHKASHKKVLFPCDKCGNKFYGKRKLVMHMKTHEENEGLKCPFCESRFKTSKCLKKHVVIHTGELPYHCTLCSNKFPTENDLQSHVAQHKKKKQFICKDCGKGYNNKILFDQHCSAHVNRKKSFKCDQCNKAFTFRSNFLKHKRTHS